MRRAAKRKTLYVERTGLCAAPPSEKRSTFKRKTLYVIMRDNLPKRQGYGPPQL
jgi:hypothetical protein